MELIEYLRFLLKYKYLFLASLLIGVGVGVGYAMVQKDLYRASMSLFVQRQPEEATSQYFTYEGFYAQQTAAAYTDNAIKLLTNDEIITRAARNAELPTDDGTLSRLKSKIAAKKDASQLIQLSVTLPNKKEAAAFTNGLANALRARTTELNAEGDRKLAVDPVNVEPYVVLVRPWLLLYGLVGAVSGLLLSVIVLSGWDYARHHRRS